MTSEWVFLKDLMVELGPAMSGCSSSGNLKRKAQSWGVEVQKRRYPDSGVMMLCVREAGAREMREKWEQEGEGVPAREENQNDNPLSPVGYFYIVELVPEDPRHLRFKLGHSDSMEGRMSIYRTSNPTCKIIYMHPAKGVWEKAIIAAVTNIEGCSNISNLKNPKKKKESEVFKVDDIEAFLDRARKFLGWFPPVSGGMETDDDVEGEGDVEECAEDEFE